MTQKELIRIAHSPDSDDAFMFYALANNKIDTGGFEFTHILKDIETLNQAAFNKTYEVSAISLHAFPQVANDYALLPSGASMGDNYGPMVIAREKFSPSILKEKTIAVPGLHTTALLALKIFEPKINFMVVPFDQIMEHIEKGIVDLGLIIHEGQLTYQQKGFHLILDLGVWWREKFNLPLPLGGNVIRKDLGEAKMKKIAKLIYDGIKFSLEHREAALDYALSFARGMDRATADQFVGMYVNDLTLDYGERGRQAVLKLFEEAVKTGALTEMPNVEFLTY